MSRETEYTPVATELEALAIPTDGRSWWRFREIGVALKRLADGVKYAVSGLITISSATPQPLGTAAVGSTGSASDAGHVHAMPTAAQVGAAPDVLSETYTFTDTTISSTALAIPATAGGNAITWRSYRVGGELTLAMTSGVFTVAYSNATPGVARDTYTSPATFNAPGMRVPLPLPARSLTRGRTLRLRANVRHDKPTSHNAVGEWCRPGIMLYGRMPGDNGASSWVYMFAEANTGLYQVGAVWNQGAVTSGSLGIVGVPSASLITGYDLEIIVSHDGKINGRYRETGATSWIDLATTRYAHGWEPVEAWLVTSHGVIDVGAGTVTAQTQNVTLEVT